MQPLKGGAVEDPCVDGAPANAQQRVGDDIGAGIGIVGCVVAIARHVHIIDQSFVQRLSADFAFPIIDRRVAEAKHLGLLVRHPGLAPGLAGRCQMALGGAAIRVAVAARRMMAA